MLDETVFPARAGMIHIPNRHPIGAQRIPRESGDDPFERFTKVVADMYSPRERG